jgi:ATP-binding cassette subfamily F protein 3
MLQINDLTYRIEGRALFEKASVSIPARHKVGLVGRNGTGKTTLLRLLTGEISPESGAISWPNRFSMKRIEQEAPAHEISVIDTVLLADTERASLLAEAETALDPNRIAEIQLRLTDINASAAPARAARILNGLGFNEAAQNNPCSQYSGGWRMRIALATVLFTEPDILLLDEPTNYLDLEGSIWLEDYLSKYPHSVLLVSHDRDLLNRSVSHILHLSEQKLSLFKGGYDSFEKQRLDHQATQLKLKKRQDDARRQMEDFVTRFRAKATKARQAQSRLKALSKLKPIAAMVTEQVPKFDFPNPSKKMSSPLVTFDQASTGYEPGKVILKEIDLRIDVTDRIGLLGANGNGKSTFAKLLTGNLKPFDGHKRNHKKMVTGYFSQHQLDDLNPNHSAYDHMRALMPDASEAQVRAKIGQFGFGADKSDTKSIDLSGGEKTRLALSIAAFHGPHILILDEPTNHLDVDSREALIHALNTYEGAVILISHDRHLMETCVDEFWLVANNTVKRYEGDIVEYGRMQIENAKKINKKQRDKGQSSENKQDRKARQEQKRADAEKRQALAPLRADLKKIESKLENNTREIEKIDAQLADVSLYETDPKKAAALSEHHRRLAKETEELEAKWLALSEELDQA